MGSHVKHMRDNNIDAMGYDGNPQTPKLTSGICAVCDLSENIKFPKEYDWVMSLEVGEHLPKQFETQFIQNIHQNNTKGVLSSWAIEGQPGHGHVNCQNNDYIKNIFKNLGYRNDIESENRLRAASSLPWFKNTIMIFVRP